jgi:hypothetical protein
MRLGRWHPVATKLRRPHSFRSALAEPWWLGRHCPFGTESLSDGPVLRGFVASLPPTGGVALLRNRPNRSALHLRPLYQRCDGLRGVPVRRLATTPPTTLAGVAAVLRFANEIEDGGMEWPATDAVGPEGWHYQLRATMAAAIEALIKAQAGKAVAS